MAKKIALNLMDTDSQDTELKINEQFATKYESKKRREEIQLLEEKYQDVKDGKEKSTPGASSSDVSSTDDDDSEDEDEDEIGELATPEVDAQILKTISSIRAKSSSIYNPEANFFSSDEMDRIRKSWKAKQAEQKKRGEKPMTLKEYHTKMLLEGHGNEEASHEEDALAANQASQLPTFVEEQERLKDEIKKAIHNVSDAGSDDEVLLVKKQKTAKELELEEDEYKKFLLENLATEANAETTMHNWLHYKEQNGQGGTQGPKSTDEEAFLINYILNRGWIDKSDKSAFPGWIGEDDSQDEAHLEQAEEFESTYNFRFEQEGAAQIMTHARKIEGLVRKTDDTRRLKRLDKEERKKAKKLVETEELKRLKNLKKQELMERLAMIQKVAGSTKVDEALLSELDEEFDAEKYDQKMASMFDDRYYEMADKESDKVTDTPEDLQEILQEVDERDARMARKKSERQALDSEATANALSETAHRMQEEYYQLHYEDKIEDLSTRFRYRSVKPSNFGLKVADILAADDKLLKQHVSLKKLAPYKSVEEQEHDILKYGKKKRLYKFYESFKKKQQKDEAKEDESKKKGKKSKTKNSTKAAV